MSVQLTEEELKAIEIFKVKQVIKKLSQAKGNGTSMISLTCPAGGQVSLLNKMLVEEFGKASHIKSRVNRQSVQTAIVSCQHALKMYRFTPPNGLVLYVGLAEIEDGGVTKEKKLCVHFEPFKPISRSIYKCDSVFHLDPLTELLEDDTAYGFIVIDGKQTVFSVVQGSRKHILSSFAVELPKKHRRGGQSSARFGRLRQEKRHVYLQKVAADAIEHFITDNMCNVAGIVLAGCADFKSDLNKSDMFDPRLQKKVVALLDISYGGEAGLNQAIQLAQPFLADVKLVKEKKVIDKFLHEIAVPNGLYVFGIERVWRCLTELAAIDTLIVWEELPVIIVTGKQKDEENGVVTDEAVTRFVTAKQLEDDPTILHDVEVEERELFVDWVATHIAEYGCHLEFVSDMTAEGAQFVSFGGIGGTLRWPVDLDAIDDLDDDDSFDSDLSDFM